MSRIETREHAMEFLFQCYFRDDPVAGQITLFEENTPDVMPDETYFLEIVYGVINKRDEIDSLFSPFLKNWKLERLPLIDRIILEIAAYEITRIDEIPTSVSINEAVKLAKKFGTDSSASYINGVLSSFEKSL